MLDLNIGFLVKNYVWWPLQTSRIRACGPNMLEIIFKYDFFKKKYGLSIKTNKHKLSSEEEETTKIAWKTQVFY